MSIIRPQDIVDFKVDEGSLDCEWISYLNGFGEIQKLFKVNPQANKVVTLNKEGVVRPDTGYSFMEKITVTNSAAVGKNQIGYLSAANQIIHFGGFRYYQRDCILALDGKITWNMENGKTYVNILYPTDTFTIHPTDWAIGRQFEAGGTVTSLSSAFAMELNHDGKVCITYFYPFDSALTYKSFSA